MTQPETPTVKRPEAMRVWMLGAFRVSVGARTIGAEEWPLRKAASLVKVLSLAPGQRLHREQSMSLLWPDSRRKTASGSLRSTLHVARAVLHPTMGGRYLASENDSLVLFPGGELWVDVAAFEGAAASARRAREPAAYRTALGAYGGDLLPEDRYEAWAEGRREELRQLYLALLVELAGLHEERHQQEPAIDALRRATAEEPILEEAHVALMRLHALSGRPEKALAQYERLRDALSRGLSVEPAAPTRRLRDEIAAGRLPPAPFARTSHEEEPPREGNHNLPAPMTSFVGRERDMVEAKRLLPMTRLLTLAGAGGSGKTRLALEVARDLIGAYPDGVWMVALAPLSEPGLLAQEVAAVLGVTERPGEALVDTLVDFLDDKQMLLVLDNCEHLIEVASRLAEHLLGSCPRLRVLATSREPLGIGGEVVWQVDPLSLPEMDMPTSVDELMRYEAVRLFSDRARQRLPDFGLTEENAGAVARVCRKLDGIPLAIELATARMGALAVEQVAQRLERSLDVLKGSSRTAAARQRTLRATLDWSHDLLSEGEKKLFGRLSVFAGGWTLEAAEAVCSAGGVEREKVLDLLGALVDKSLVVAGATTSSALRYRMLEPIRQYSQEKLGQSGQAEETRERHGVFFLALAEEAEPELAGSEQTVWVEQLEAEHDNLREALSWALERKEGKTALRLGAALWRFWNLRGYLSEGTKWLGRVLGECEPAASPARVKALEGMGWMFQFQGDQERARATYEEMLGLSRELDDNGNVATALNSLGTVAAQQGDNGRARALLQENLEVIEALEEEGDPATPLKKFYVFNLLGYLAINDEGDHARGATLWEESLALAREVGDGYSIGMALTSLAHVALLQKDFERVKSRSQEALALAHELGSAGVEIFPSNLINLGLASVGLGDLERAMGSFEEALLKSKDLGTTPQVIETLEGMASLAGAMGNATRAAHLWGAAEAAREATGIGVFTSDEWALHEPHLASARTELGDAAWEVALTEGRAMSLDEASQHALSEGADQPEATTEQDPSAHDGSMGSLTLREREIALLVARGLTNRQISTQLSISERTAANHVAKILKKLGLHSRAQIATWATETQLRTSPRD